MAEAANDLCVNCILESRETLQGSYGELGSHPGLQSKQFCWMMRLAGEQFNPHLSVLTLERKSSFGVVVFFFSPLVSEYLQNVIK